MAFAYKEHAVAPADRRALRGLDPARQVAAGHGRFALSGRMIMLLSLVLVDVLAAQIAFYLGAELGSGPGRPTEGLASAPASRLPAARAALALAPGS